MSLIFDKYIVNGIVYRDNPLTLTADKNLNIEAHWIEENEMSNQNLKGEVTLPNGTPASEIGETVTITITKPDNDTEQIIALTDANGNYSIVYTGVAGNYKAVAYIPASSQYSEATSNIFEFTLTLMLRTITLHG